MGHYLLAVLVGDNATVETIDTQLAKPMRRLLRAHRVDDYRFGGGVTGAWDPGYDPQADPANWRPCPRCAGTTRVAGQSCTVCADAQPAGRGPGTVLAMPFDWVRHPGDLVPLSRLMHRDWRFPPRPHPPPRVDPAGVGWLPPHIPPPTRTHTGTQARRAARALRPAGPCPAAPPRAAHPGPAPPAVPGRHPPRKGAARPGHHDNPAPPRRRTDAGRPAAQRRPGRVRGPVPQPPPARHPLRDRPAGRTRPRRRRRPGPGHLLRRDRRRGPLRRRRVRLPAAAGRPRLHPPPVGRPPPPPGGVRD